MKLNFHMLQTKDEQVMSAGISKLQIFSCTFTQRHRHNNEVGIVLGDTANLTVCVHVSVCGCECVGVWGCECVCVGVCGCECVGV